MESSSPIPYNSSCSTDSFDVIHLRYHTHRKICMYELNFSLVIMLIKASALHDTVANIGIVHQHYKWDKLGTIVDHRKFYFHFVLVC